MLRNNFCVFILTHGRPNNVYTIKALNKWGYTGKIVLVIDYDDPTLEEYKKLYPDIEIQLIDKKELSKTMDTMDNLSGLGLVMYARNACFEIAEKLGYRYFLELDDDYVEFQLRYAEDNKLKLVYPKSLDDIFETYLEFLDCSGAITVAMAQGGDFIGGLYGAGYTKKIHRKAMNSFFCDTTKKFQFFGRINEDVNMYCLLGSKGQLCFTVVDCMVNQKDTQLQQEGLTPTYLGLGTYVKSFYSVMCCPAFVKISIMGDGHYRIHHSINWENAVPKIISSRFKI